MIDTATIISPLDLAWISATDAEVRDQYAAIATIYQDLYDAAIKELVTTGQATAAIDWARLALLTARDHHADRAEAMDNGTRIY